MKFIQTLLILFCALVFSMPAIAQRAANSQLLTDATATGAGTEVQPVCATTKTFQAYGITSAGAGAATVVIEASNLSSPTAGTRVDWVTLGTITLTLSTTRSGDGFVSDARWRYIRAYVSAISGTNATVNVFMGC